MTTMLSTVRACFTIPVRACLTIAVLASASLEAQQAPPVPFQPTPLDTTTAAARRAREATTLILTGDRAALSKYLKEHAAPAFTPAQQDSSLTHVYTLIRPLTVRIAGYDDLGGGRIGVPVSQGDAPPRHAILVFLTPEAPYRIAALGVATIGTP
ncbi:MAG: hypothetical protein V4617_07905 [Gemmatimonadota bacterium]